MKKVPISLIVDDPAPGVAVYHYHINPPFTKDGRPLVKFYPNELLYRFCDVIERNGIKGKFSVVPTALRAFRRRRSAIGWTPSKPVYRRIFRSVPRS